MRNWEKRAADARDYPEMLALANEIRLSDDASDEQKLLAQRAVTSIRTFMRSGTPMSDHVAQVRFSKLLDALQIPTKSGPSRPIEPRKIHMPELNIELRTIGEYQAATSLIQKLVDSPEGSADKVRLMMLVAAVEAWEAKHDDATALGE